jgi:hypothetical protein
VARQKKEKFVDRMKERATDWREWATRRVKGVLLSTHVVPFRNIILQQFITVSLQFPEIPLTCHCCKCHQHWCRQCGCGCIVTVAVSIVGIVTPSPLWPLPSRSKSCCHH